MKENIRNWHGEISYNAQTAYPETADTLKAILSDSETFPSPIRPVGSNHSMTNCAKAECLNHGHHGTAVFMKHISNCAPDDPLKVIQEPALDHENLTVTAKAGTPLIAVANYLKENGYQFYVNAEIGNVSIGAAACGATKDSSFSGEFGQIGSYATAMKLIKPSGEEVILNENDEHFNALRCSYGLFGIVTEVTFKIKPLEVMKFDHQLMDLEEFISDETQGLPYLNQFPQIDTKTGNAKAARAFLFPAMDLVVVEQRECMPAQTGPINSEVWARRNKVWHMAVATPEDLDSAFIPDDSSIIKSVKTRLRGRFANMIDALPRYKQEKLLAKFLVSLHAENVYAPEKMINYEDNHEQQWPRFTFSMWAFPKQTFAEVISDFFKFCREEAKDLLPKDTVLVSYLIKQDQSSLLSYSYDGDIWSIDPIATGRGPTRDQWQEFIRQLNEFCSGRGGKPLFNQTPNLTPQQSRMAFGGRIDDFEAIRKQFDPENRMLNLYFAERLNF